MPRPTRSGVLSPARRPPPPRLPPPRPPQVYQWIAPSDGDLNLQVCSAYFTPTVTIWGPTTTQDYNATTDVYTYTTVANTSIGCGGGFIDCSDPLLVDPDSELE